MATKTKKEGDTAVEPTKCPITKEEFAKNAKPLTLVINGETRSLAPKEFATGSFGWYNGEKVTIDVGGVPVKCQIGLNLIAVGSNPNPRKK